MIAEEGDDADFCRAFEHGFQREDLLDHAFAVGAAVNIVSEMHDDGR
jgi:hypothetical protein